MPTTESPTIISLEHFSAGDLSAVETACKRRDDLLALAYQIEIVDDKESAERALATLKSLKAFTNEIELERKRVKAPILELSSQIDELAKNLTQELTIEYTRISQPLSLYNKKQQELAEEARRKAWEEEQRILAEARDKEEAEREAAAKAAAELQAKAERARSAEKAATYEAAAEIVAQKAEAKAEALQDETAQKIADVRVAARLAVPGKLAGVSSRKNPKFKVTNITALYEAYPMFVKMEPNTAVINAAIKNLQEGEKIPGLEFWFEASVSLR